MLVRGPAPDYHKDDWKKKKAENWTVHAPTLSKIEEFSCTYPNENPARVYYLDSCSFSEKGGRNTSSHA